MNFMEMFGRCNFEGKDSFPQLLFWECEISIYFSVKLIPLTNIGWVGNGTKHDYWSEVYRPALFPSYQIVAEYKSTRNTKQC